MTNEFTFNQFKQNGEVFFDHLLAEMETLSFQVSALKSDHLCFRTETLEEYEFYKEKISHHAVLLTETEVNGRPIATYRLKEPFRTRNQEIDLLEIPAPKEGTFYKTGFEHAEFIINESFDRFIAKYPLLSFKKLGNRNFNQELCLQTRQGQAKFHHVSLERVIEIENANIKDIIFDFDGTLLNSRENIHEINRIVFSEILDRTVTLEEAEQNFRSEFSQLLKVYGVDCPSKKETAIEMWSRTSERFQYDLFPGIRALLKKLETSRFRLHLWTARDEVSARRILEHHKLDSLFSTLSFFSHLGSKPQVTSLTLDWQSLEKDSVLVIGDSSSDVLGAKNIGGISIAALWDPYSCENSLRSSGAELLFDRIADLEEWLLAYAKE